MRKNNLSERKEQLQIIQHLLKKDLDMELKEAHTNEQVKNELIHFLQFLLDNDFERLLQGLYRIDVNEEKVKQILTVGAPENITRDLAELIFERQQQKAITRMQYR